MLRTARIGVSGFGLIGRRHAEIIHRLPELSLAAIAEPDTRGETALQSLGVPVYADLPEMIATEDLDGIVLATPTPLHLKQGLLCIQAGVPVLIEKPIAVTSRDAEILTHAAQAAQIPLLIGHHRRHNGMVQAAKTAIMNGAIGDIKAVQATCWLYKPSYYFAEAPWRTRKGAGPISVNLVHDVDLLRHLCGEIKSVQAVAVSSSRGFENEEIATAILRFQSEAVGMISVSDSIASPWSWELTSGENPAYPKTLESCYLIGGSKGSLSLPDLRLWSHDGVPDWWTPISARSLLCDAEDPLVVQMKHFARVIAGDEAPLVSGIEGLKSLEAVEAVARSSATGQEIFMEHAP